LYYFGCDKQLSEINTIDLQEYCRWLTKQGKSAARINSYISAFKAIYHWAIENELINNIPNLSAIKKLPRSKTSKPIFTPEEIRRLLNHAGYRMKATVWLGLNCGLGCTDCAELLWANVDLEAGRLNFPRTKTDVARYLPLLEERGASGYARFKDRLRLSSPDEFGEHTTTIKPQFRIWVDTFRPESDRKRWYHRFSALTAIAGCSTDVDGAAWPTRGCFIRRLEATEVPFPSLQTPVHRKCRLSHRKPMPPGRSTFWSQLPTMRCRR
jgi:integrase